MDIPPSIQLDRARRRRKRRTVAGRPPATDVTIVSVTVTEDGTATWKFTAGVSDFPDVADVAGFAIAGQSPNNVIVLTGEGFILSYDAPVEPGQAWAADQGLGTIDVNFDNGGTLALPENGTVLA